MSHNTWRILNNEVQYTTENGNTFKAVGRAFTSTETGYALDVRFHMIKSALSSDGDFLADKTTALIAATSEQGQVQIARLIAETLDSSNSQSNR